MKDDEEITIESGKITQENSIHHEVKTQQEKIDKACERVIEIFDNILSGNNIIWKEDDNESFHQVIKIMNLYYKKK